MPPPTADYPLNTALVAELVTAQFPEVRGTPERLGAGWDFEVYRVGGWLFRFPRRAWSLRALDQELLFQPHVVQAMAPLSMPRFELVAVRGYGFTDELRRHYTAPQDPNFAERLRWGSRVLSLFFMNKLADSDRGMLVRWCHFAFEDTDGR